VPFEDDVAKKRLRIERGEYERELENLRKENDFLKKESEHLKRDKRRKSVDTDKGERMYHTMHFSPRVDEAEGRNDTRQKSSSWDLDREKAESTGDFSFGKYMTVDSRTKSFSDREDIGGPDKDGEGTGDRSVERRRWDMEREIEMEKWKKQGQSDKDQERSKWKLEKEKELERLKKHHELEKVTHPSFMERIMY
jgi:hypothetical protein